MYLNRITLIGFLGSDAERKSATQRISQCSRSRPKGPGKMTPERGNHEPNGIDASPLGDWPNSPAVSPGAHVAVEGELRSHEYQREVAVSNQRTAIPQRVWEIRVDSVLKLDRAARHESSADSYEEVPR